MIVNRFCLKPRRRSISDHSDIRCCFWSTASGRKTYAVMMFETFARSSTRLADSALRDHHVDGLGGGDDGAEGGVFKVTPALVRAHSGLAGVVGGEAVAIEHQDEGAEFSGCELSVGMSGLG
jgi:hypothetical protein